MLCSSPSLLLTLLFYTSPTQCWNNAQPLHSRHRRGYCWLALPHHSSFSLSSLSFWVLKNDEDMCGGMAIGKVEFCVFFLQMECLVS